MNPNQSLGQIAKAPRFNQNVNIEQADNGFILRYGDENYSQRTFICISLNDVAGKLVELFTPKQ